MDYISWTVWTAFAIDFTVRLALARERGSYALRHWYDVALIALPVLLRPLRLLRLLSFLRILNRSAGGNLAGRATTYVIGAAVMGVGLGAVAAVDAEQEATDANITTIGDALWWADSTSTNCSTVGDPARPSGVENTRQAKAGCSPPVAKGSTPSTRMVGDPTKPRRSASSDVDTRTCWIFSSSRPTRESAVRSRSSATVW